MPDKSPAWERRKQLAIIFLREAPEEVHIVACTDKLHNLRCIAGDYAELGEELSPSLSQARLP